MFRREMQVADYVRDLSKQLSIQAYGAGFDSAGYLLDLVVLEMTQVIEAGKKKPKPAKAA